MTDLDAVVAAVAPVVEALGLELYDVELSGTGRARVLRVMIDRPAPAEGEARRGIDLEAIAAATEAVSPLLDTPPLDRVISGSYSLEVSSPGLERPLRTAAHFARAVGETISVKTRTGNMPARRVRGVVQAVAEVSCTLLDDDDGTEHTISYSEVVQARTVFEWGNETGPSRSRRAAAKGAKPAAGSGTKEGKKEVVRR
jgi:ribosome maturation factor RimP